MGGAFSFARRGPQAPGACPGPAAPFSLALGDVLASLAEATLFLRVAAVNHRVSCGCMVSLLRYDCDFVGFEREVGHSSSIISLSIIELLCFTMLFVRSFIFTRISTGTI